MKYPNYFKFENTIPRHFSEGQIPLRLCIKRDNLEKTGSLLPKIIKYYLGKILKDSREK